MSTRIRPARLTLAAALALSVAAPAAVASAGEGHGGGHDRPPRLEGRAVLPVETYAPGPPSGSMVIPGPGVRNGITFPTPSQPVEGFSAIVEGRHDGEWLAMADNGFGTKDNSADFNIRAYYLRPDFKTADGGSGAIDADLRSSIEFSDPWQRFPYPIRNMTGSRVLTGADIDPESLQRAKNGDLWVGDEFGPWVLHFDSRGRLLEAPFALPDGLVSPGNPEASDPVDPAPVTVDASRGIEAMAMTPNGRFLYVVMEGTVRGDPVSSRRIYEFDVKRGEFTAEMTPYRAELDADGVDRHFISDVQAVDSHHLVMIERDCATCGRQFRSVYEVDLRDVAADGYLAKTLVVDLTKVPDPDGVSLPAIHAGDVGIGDPFTVMCESVEALRILSNRSVLIGCDNNFPNTGRNPGLADDNELITVAVPHL